MKTILCLIVTLVTILSVNPLTAKVTDEQLYFGDEYNGAINTGSGTEYITYSTKEEEEYFINGGLPLYYDTSTRPKTCANVAGTIVLGYYDKTYDELIPNFSSARVIRDKVLYSTQTEAVQSVMDKLYVYMETNSTDAGGTSISGFKNGLKKYVNEQGRNFSYSGTGQNAQLNKSAYIQAIQNNNPIALFVSKYNLIPIKDFSVSATEDKLEKQYYSGNHVLMGYGIKEIRYYNAIGTLTRNLTLLMVATGYRQDPLYYIEMDSNNGMIDSFSIKIY